MTQFETMQQQQQQRQQQQQQQQIYLNTNNSNNNSSFQSAALLHPKMSGAESAMVDDMKIQIYYNGVITVIYLRETGLISLERFLVKIREICQFDKEQPFTLKWVDEEGDPCTLSSQMELDEAIRLYYLNKESELVLHVFANRPDKPGHQCAGEDRSIYRRGARRWRKFYLVNGHKYQAKRFARTALCKVCHDRIWGLGRQGYKCLECKIMVHKRCHKFILTQCNDFQQFNLNTNNNNNSNNSASPGFSNPLLQSFRQQQQQQQQQQQTSIATQSPTTESNLLR